VFLKEPGWKLRGVTRDASRSSATSWKHKGVEIVEADLDNPESLKEAFKGAHVIFGVTDFWGPMFNQNSYGLLRQGQTINEYCYELEIKRGKNMADAAAAVDTLERFIFSSLADIKSIAEGKYRHVYHFDAKAEIMAYIKKSLPTLAAKTSELQLAEFATNWKMWRLRRPVKVCAVPNQYPPTNIFGSNKLIARGWFMGIPYSRKSRRLGARCCAERGYRSFCSRSRIITPGANSLRLWKHSQSH
jgi:hypothetical protein